MVPPTPVGTRAATAANNAGNAWSSPQFMGGQPQYAPFANTNSPQGGPNPFPADQFQQYGRDGQVGEYVPTPADLERWNDPSVMKFRKNLRFFLAANVALMALSVFAGKDLLGITSIWSIMIAFRYAKLWSNDRDWRDVLHQPQHRMFGEVVSSLSDSFMATFSRKHREQLQRDGRLDNKLGISLSSKPRQLQPGQMGSAYTSNDPRMPGADERVRGRDDGLLAVGGIIMGLLLGLLVVAYFNNFGFYVGNMGLSGFLIQNTIYAKLNLSDAVTLTIISLIITLVAGLYPAILAARMEPIDALHGEN